MGQKMINVKPIKDKEVLNQFGKELQKGKHGKRDYLIMAIGIKTGLRISDILNLKVSDVKNKTQTEIIEIKTGKKRTVHLKSLTSNIIDYLNTEHSAESEWLFPSPTDSSRHLASHQYYKILQKVADNLGLDYIGTHTLRKTFSYFFLKQNKGDIVTLMKILNHSSQAVTLRYAGIEEEDIKAKLEDFDPFK
ncbi:TPA: tyrosine-type recombinase/integrase [Enterococcus faecium]|uniref:tyrosine-type recombinase/integrase n=1 Tax=Enterococcus faecium TaxID=1352 RepID=UPI0010C0F842|nr:tyrosine-type recombinase/integrase [Enterococcus faecium]EIB6784593.1 tyrosine-type recombinase/integrase [Enterococcus faecalis]TKN13932.1 site-specific integrase [Enterococcus faecium]TKN23262.1 site-specific integrase [Enterococcus faecium]TKN69762.1 site-specific integrase [Enterococcus faecium]